MNLTRRGKVILIGVLTVFVIGLGIANLLFPSSDPGPAARRGDIAAGRSALDSAVDSSLARFGIPPASVRRIAVRPAGAAVVRWEIRARIPAGFPGLLLNHDLSLRLLPLGARVIGTENTQEGRIAFHIRKDGVIVRSVILQETH